MTSVTLIKPASPVAPGSSQQPSWGTNAAIVWPCSSQMAGIGTGTATGSFTDELIGTYSLTWQQSASPNNDFSYDTAGNGSGTNGLVGLALNRPSRFNSSDGILVSNAALSLSALSGLVVIKPPSTVADDNSFYGFGNNAGTSGTRLRINSTTHKVELFSSFTNAVVWTSAGTVPAGEWHVLAWTFDATTITAVKFNLAIDGTADTNNTDSAGTFSLSGEWGANSTHYWYTDGSANGHDGNHDIAFVVLWTSAVATSDLVTRSTASSTASAGPYAMITAVGGGGGGTGDTLGMQIFRPNQRAWR